MKFQKIGMRIIKTAIAVFISISIYIILLLIDSSRGKDLNDLSDITKFSNMYTPFFAGIAAAYALHRDSKSSYDQAKIRSLGSIIGGYFGMLVILLVEYVLIDLISLNTSNYMLYLLFTYILVSIGIIPLIAISVALKQQTSVFISCLTYLSVTISVRNGGMPVYLFATNRVLSTLIGTGISLLVNNLILFRRKNKNILFVSSLDNNFLSQGNINPYIKNLDLKIPREQMIKFIEALPNEYQKNNLVESLSLENLIIRIFETKHRNKRFYFKNPVTF